MKSIKNLVTGGAGFLGSHLIDSLMESDEEVVCLDNFLNGKKNNIGSVFLSWLKKKYEINTINSHFSASANPKNINANLLFCSLIKSANAANKEAVKKGFPDKVKIIRKKLVYANKNNSKNDFSLSLKIK